MRKQGPSWTIRLVSGIVTAMLAVFIVACTTGSKAVQEREAAPPFALQSVEGRQVALADYAGGQPILLYFHMAYG